MDSMGFQLVLMVVSMGFNGGFNGVGGFDVV